MIKAGFVLLLLCIQQEPKKDCPMSEVKPGLYCDTCKVILEDDTILNRAFCNKCCEGLDPKDRVKARAVEVCIRTYYIATCHPDQKSLAPGLHCGKDMVLKVSKVRVVYRCDECAMKHDTPGECCKKPLRLVCGLSGEFPHTTR